MASDTGNGATLTLSEDTTSYQIQNINIGGQSVEALDVSLLATTDDKEYIPGDLAETPEINVQVLFDVTSGLPDLKSTHTATVTFPLGPAQTTTTKATFSGTGFITSREWPELVNDQVQQATFVIKLDGGYNSGTAPTYTAGA